jgi:hypothetical protein
MKLSVENRCSDFDSYRAARVKSLFNVERGCDFDLEIEIPVDEQPWALGIIVGPSGTGKTSLENAFSGQGASIVQDGRLTVPSLTPLPRKAGSMMLPLHYRGWD